VDRAADRVAAEVRHVERLGHHPLAGEGGVAVEEDREDERVPPGAEAELLARACDEGHRVHRLEVLGFRDEVDVQAVAGAAPELAHGAEVVLHVASPRRLAGSHVLEAGEDVGGPLPYRVHHDVEPPPVAHPDHGLPGALEDGPVQELVEEGRTNVAPSREKRFVPG